MCLAGKKEKILSLEAGEFVNLTVLKNFCWIVASNANYLWDLVGNLSCMRQSLGM